MWLPDHENDLDWTKTCPAIITPKLARSALSRDPTAVTSATNHSIFTKWPWVTLLELKRRFLHHKVALRPHKWPELAKNTQNHPKNTRFCSVRGSDSCYIGNQPLYFHQMTLSQLIRALEVGSYITKWLPANHDGLNWLKNGPAKINPKIARFTMSRDPTAVTLATNHSVFTRWP